MRISLVGIALSLWSSVLFSLPADAQSRLLTPAFHEQRRVVGELRAAGATGVATRDRSANDWRAAADSSDYNWGAAWLGMGIGAVVGAGVGFIVLGPSDGEAPPEAYAIGGAILFGILGWFVGYAVGNP